MKEFDDGDFVVISGPTSPRVAYALQRTAEELQLAFEVDSFPSTSIAAELTVGIGAAKEKILRAADGKVTRKATRSRIRFRVPCDELVRDESDWPKLRMAAAVRWKGGFNGTDRLRERFRHLDNAAPHAGLSSNPNHWAPLDVSLWDGVNAADGYDLTPTSSPRNTDWTDGSSSYVEIYDISRAGPSMSFEVRMPPLFVDRSHTGTEDGSQTHPFDALRS